MRNIHIYEWVGLGESLDLSLNCQNKGGNICERN